MRKAKGETTTPPDPMDNCQHRNKTRSTQTDKDGTWTTVTCLDCNHFEVE